ncbi:MAG: adenosine deaminase [Legionellaceae bacterium]|nr:adenosine deaminase [Legionellaceae bacterium]
MPRLLFTLILHLLIAQTAMADVHATFRQVRDNPNALYAFLKKMPKGGELHYHLAGGAYPESMLRLAAEDNAFCIRTHDYSVYKDAENCRGIRTTELPQQPELYQRLLRAWSMRDFIPGNHRSPHDHFFASFMKFIPVLTDYRAPLLADVVQRAGDQHVLYMEIMDIPDDARSVEYAPADFSLENMAQAREQLLADAGFRANVQTTIQRATQSIAQSRQWLACESHPDSAACQVEVKLQYYVLREQALNAVFAQTLNAFEAANASDAIVGVNLVQPEDGMVALRDYRQQMTIFKFMHQYYPKVHIALHAGEITRDYVTPEQLRFHIRDAIEVGQAERIGHGVDIAQEHGADALLAMMAQRQIPVEVNLESNRVILGVAGKRHPLNYYLQAQVPVVLSTDDEGILRTDLTSQYLMAVIDHQVDYASLRQINRNALTYSFMDGESLWQDPRQAIAVNACQKLNAPACLAFVAKNPKARKQRQLELALAQFEGRQP